MLYYLKNFTYVFYMMMLCIPASIITVLFFRHPANTGIWAKIYAETVKPLLCLRTRVSGRENLPDTPVVYVFNHQSSLDAIPFGVLNLKRVVLFGKKELAYIPFVGWFFYLAGNVLLDRSDNRRAAGQIDAGVEAIKKRRVSIAIFPEGTRNREDTDFLPFKKGAFNLAVGAGVAVIPVVISNFGSFLDRKKKQFKCGTIQIEILPPFDTTGLDKSGTRQFTEDVRAAMKTAYDRMNTETLRKA